MKRQDPATVERLLAMRTVAVVGLSANPARPSHGVAAYLLEHGYRVVPVNPMESAVLGQSCYPSLLDVPEPVELVNVFRDAAAVPEISEQAVAIGAKGLWLQLGVISPSGVATAEAAGLDVVMDLCVKIEHARRAG